jgi:hypothetical protein
MCCACPEDLPVCRLRPAGPGSPSEEPGSPLTAAETAAPAEAAGTKGAPAKAGPPRGGFTLDHPLYATDQFRMFNFKITPCRKRYTHDCEERAVDGATLRDVPAAARPPPTCRTPRRAPCPSLRQRAGPTRPAAGRRNG